MKKRSIVVILYVIFLMLPIYWLINMSFKTTNEILGGFSAFPREFTLDSYRKIFTDPTWYGAYINSITYVAINTVISVAVALPAAYAFSRYRFLGDKHLFFWLLSNRMAPAAVFVLPFVNLYSAVGLLTRLGRWRFRTPCSMSHWRSGSSKASCLVSRRNWTRQPMSMVIPSRGFL